MDGGIFFFFVKVHAVHRMSVREGEVLLYLRHLTSVWKCASVSGFPKVFLLWFWGRYLWLFSSIIFTNDCPTFAYWDTV